LHKPRRDLGLSVEKDDDWTVSLARLLLRAGEELSTDASVLLRVGTPGYAAVGPPPLLPDAQTGAVWAK